MKDIIFTLALIFLFGIILLFGVKKSPSVSQKESLRRFNSLRGIFALDVLVGHIVQYEHTYSHIFSSFMIVSVGFFFFVSAFGMVTSFKEKSNYLCKTFLIRKCGYLLSVAIIVYTLSCIINLFTRCYIWNFATVFDAIKGFFSRTNWYIWELIVFYIIFYIVYRFIPKYRALIVSMLTFAVITILYFCDFQEMYYASSLCFPAGLIIGEHYPEIKEFCDSVKGYVFTFLLLILGASSLVFGHSLFSMCYLRNIMCIAIVLLLLETFKFLDFGNPILSFLTKYSTEIYLFQFFWIFNVAMLPISYYLRMPIVISITILSSVMLHCINSIVKRYISQI